MDTYKRCVSARVALRIISFTLSILTVTQTLSQAQTYSPLTSADFKPVIGPGGVLPQGFGDRQNSWAWSMTWFKGKLVVGTARSYDCMVQAALNRGLGGLIPYPPLDPDELCTPNYRDLALRAEIWTWTPGTNQWARVYQSPQDVPIPDAPGKFVARDVGFRYMHVHVEPDGTEALYVSGLSPRFIYGTAVSSGRLLRSTDLVNFTAVPAAPGTNLANLSNAGFRGLTSYKGKLVVIAGSIEGNGVVIESANPKLGNNSFRVITRPGELASELATFNGFLYLSLSGDNGFKVVKTDAVETVPNAGYTFKEVIPRGGGRTLFPNRDVWSMKVFKDRLYIGGNGVQSFFGAEFYRINPDDTWELISGDPRKLPGESTERRPSSGLGPGFGWGLNAHMWRQEVFDGRLYVGTFDMSTVFKDVPLINLLLDGEMGADLWYTNDGVTFYPVEKRGFTDKFNFGFRSLLSTPHGLFLGTANYYYGLEIYVAKPPSFSALAATLQAPQKLDLEQTGANVLLSWEDVPNVKSYAVYRSIQTQQFLTTRDGSGPVWIPGEFERIGTTAKPLFTSPIVSTPALYYVQAENGGGAVSGRSNYIGSPALTPTVTMKSVNETIQKYQATRIFTSNAGYLYFLSEYTKAAQAAVRGDLKPLAQVLLVAKNNQHQGAQLLKPYAAEDLEVQLGRLIKRFNLKASGLLTISDL